MRSLEAGRGGGEERRKGDYGSKAGFPKNCLSFFWQAWGMPPTRKKQFTPHEEPFKILTRRTS